MLVHLALSVDRNPLDPRLRFWRLRQGHGKHAIFERGGNLVLLDLISEWNAAFEAAIEPFGELAVLVISFGPFLAAQRQHGIIEQDLDILLIQSGNLSRDLDLVVGFGDFNIRPSGTEARKLSQCR